jgi:expansin (peptidoglycan-binding protein)
MIQYILLLSIFKCITAYYVGDGTAYTLGSIESGNCNFLYSGYAGAITDYAAINNAQWDALTNCGRCVTVKCVDSRCTSSQSATVQILDRCPECKMGDLDLSPSVFKTLTGSDPSRYKIQWEFIKCPITGNIRYCFSRGGNGWWAAIQPTNFADGIYRMRINDMEATITPNAYYYLTNQWVNTSDVRIELTNINGYTITDRVSLRAGECSEGTSQFPDVSYGYSDTISIDEMEC